MGKLRRFLSNIKRVFKWLPIIWNDRWFDNAYLLRIIAFKLRQDAEKYINEGHCLHSERYGHQMIVAANLCERIIEDDYYTPWHVNLRKPLWGRLSEEESKKFCWIVEREAEMRKQDLDYLLTIFRRQLFSWWD